MGPLSAVVIAAGFALVGSTTAQWVKMSVTLYAWLLLIFAIVILLDAFVFGTGPRWVAYRGRRQQPPA